MEGEADEECSNTDDLAIAVQDQNFEEVALKFEKAPITKSVVSIYAQKRLRKT